MRRLAQHAVVGVGFAAVVAAASVVGLSSPAVEDVAIAVPAGSGVVQAPSTTQKAPSRAQADEELRIAVLRARQNDLAAREAERARVEAATRASSRAKFLAVQTKAISAQHGRLKAAAKKAAVERAARKRALANRGYLPGTTDPREMARQILKNRFGYGEAQFTCFDNIIMRESRWSVTATNPSSGAYGIPQALPGSKMAKAGSDWRTNPATQIIWAVGYMEDRYGSPCQAWSFKRAHGWY